MASLDSKLTKLRRRAAIGDVEVEHLLAFAVLGDPCAVPTIRELQTVHGWARSTPATVGKIVPLASWAEAVCLYLEGGSGALLAHARKRSTDSFRFAVGVLEELKNESSVLALAELANDLTRKLPARRRDGLTLATAANLTLCFKNPPPIDEKSTERIRTLLHMLLQQELTEPERCTVVCALRGVGDKESIRLVDQLPAFTGPYIGLESMAAKAIRKRLRR